MQEKREMVVERTSIEDIDHDWRQRHRIESPSTMCLHLFEYHITRGPAEPDHLVRGSGHG